MNKKFEPHIEGKKIGTVDAFWDTLRNKYIAGVLSAFVTITSITGFYFKYKIEEVNARKITEETIDDYSNLLRTNEEKKYFINKALEELRIAYQSDGNIVALNLYNKLLDKYKKFDRIETSLNSEDKPEYYEILMFSSIEKEQEKMLNILNEIIQEIEEKTKMRFGVDFLLEKDDNKNLTIEEQIEEKQYFVNEVLEEFRTAYETDGNTVALSFYNKLLDKYKNVSHIEYCLNPDNYNEYYEILMFSSIEKEQEKMLNILNEIIQEIEEKTKMRFGVDFKKEKISK